MSRVLEVNYYVLAGLLEEIKKVNRLSNYQYLCEAIIIPAIKNAWKNGRLTSETAEALHIVAKRQVVASGDLKSVFQVKSSTSVSRKVQSIIKDGLLIPEKENSRRYTFSFNNPYMMPSITKMLAEERFLPDNL